MVVLGKDRVFLLDLGHDLALELRSRESLRLLFGHLRFDRFRNGNSLGCAGHRESGVPAGVRDVGDALVQPLHVLRGSVTEIGLAGGGDGELVERSLGLWCAVNVDPASGGHQLDVRKRPLGPLDYLDLASGGESSLFKGQSLLLLGLGDQLLLYESGLCLLFNFLALLIGLLALIRLALCLGNPLLVLLNLLVRRYVARVLRASVHGGVTTERERSCQGGGEHLSVLVHRLLVGRADREPGCRPLHDLLTQLGASLDGQRLA